MGWELTAPPFDPNRMFVVPPAWNKPVGDIPLWWLWEDAQASLRDSRALIVVGYSLPRTDMWAEALLRAAASSRSAPFTHVLIANPDSSVAERLIGVLNAAVGATTRVVQFRGFQ